MHLVDVGAATDARIMKLFYGHQHDGCQAQGKGVVDVGRRPPQTPTQARNAICHENDWLGLMRVSRRLWRFQARGELLSSVLSEAAHIAAKGDSSRCPEVRSGSTTEVANDDSDVR